MPSDLQASEATSSTKYVFRVALLAALGGFMFGFDISIISGALMFLEREFNLDAYQQGFAVSSAAIGCIAGPLVAVSLSDWIGRRRTLIVSAILLGISAIGTALPRTITEFNIYRIVGGVGVGLASVVAPMYIAEMSPARLRGRLVAINQLAIVIGLFTAVLVSYFLSFSGAWRWMFGIEALPVALWMIGLFFLPETPRWLSQKNRRSEAFAVLLHTEGLKGAHAALSEIDESLRETTGDWRGLLQPSMTRPLIIAVTLAVLQQMTGVSILLVYAPTVFQMAGFTEASDAIWQAVPLNLWNIFCTAISFWLVDRVGRRPLLLVGTFGMALGLLLMGISFQQGWPGMAALLIMFLCVGAYVSSLAPLAWLIMSEIFPTRLRGRAMAIAGAALWLSFFLGSQFFPPLREFFETRYGSPAGVFWLFSAVCLFAFGFTWTMVPETKGRSLESIANSWKKPTDATIDIPPVRSPGQSLAERAATSADT